VIPAGLRQLLGLSRAIAWSPAGTDGLRNHTRGQGDPVFWPRPESALRATTDPPFP